uniref:(northern house mosquito) hypothetical protein n=1 Tax=Culex pipiens TaxID=7175 RepID=A0A8D8H321_CULPI
MLAQNLLAQQQSEILRRMLMKTQWTTQTYSNSSRQVNSRAIRCSKTCSSTPRALFRTTSARYYTSRPSNRPLRTRPFSCLSTPTVRPAQSVGAEPNGCRSEPSAANSMFPGGQTEADLSNSLHHMLHLSQLQGPGLAEFRRLEAQLTSVDLLKCSAFVPFLLLFRERIYFSHPFCSGAREA